MQAPSKVQEEEELGGAADSRKREVSQLEEPDSGSQVGPPPLGLESWVYQPDSGLDFGLELGWLNQGPYGEDVDHDDDDDVDDDDVMGSTATIPNNRIAVPALPCLSHGQVPPHRQALSEHPDDQGLPLLGNHDCIPPTGLISALSSPSPALTTSQFDFTTNPYSNSNLTVILGA